MPVEPEPPLVDASTLASVDLAELDTRALGQLVEDHHPADVAVAVARLERDQRVEVLARIDANEAAELSEHLPPQDVLLLLKGLDSAAQGDVLATLSDDVRVDVLQEVQDLELRDRLVALLPASERGGTEDLLSWPEESAGGRMTASIAWIRSDLTIKQAIKALRHKQDFVDFLSRLFVVDEQRRLVGQLRLRDLVFHRFGELVGDIMEPVEFAIQAEADQEEAAQMIQRYDLAALPVLDSDSRLLGAITADDAFEILEVETTEDVEKGAGIAPGLEGESYLGASWLSLVRRRFPWVLALALVGTFSGMVIYHFEDTLSGLFHLALYMPMVVAAGGNTGGQAATMVIRAMSLGEVAPSDALRIAGREFKVGLTLGLLMAVAIEIQIMLFLPYRSQLPEQYDTFHLGAVVALSLLAQITSSTMLGSLLPLAARKLGIDPAAVASPALASMVDITGLLIYFGIAQILLGI